MYHLELAPKSYEYPIGVSAKASNSLNLIDVDDGLR
jgi:hypothetical protein